METSDSTDRHSRFVVPRGTRASQAVRRWQAHGQSHFAEQSRKDVRAAYHERSAASPRAAARTSSSCTQVQLVRHKKSCIANLNEPVAGAMGIHIGQSRSPRRRARSARARGARCTRRNNGSLKLAAVEYVAFKPRTPQPELFGSAVRQQTNLGSYGSSSRRTRSGRSTRGSGSRTRQHPRRRVTRGSPANPRRSAAEVTVRPARRWRLAPTLTLDELLAEPGPLDELPEARLDLQLAVLRRRPCPG